jgi:putative aldouronate transport system substrate-binding protein
MYNGDVDYTYAFMGAYGVTSGFYHDNKVIKYGPAQPQFKDYLTLMNKWYKEGLIDKDYLTSNSKIIDGKMLDNQIGSMVGWAGSGLGKYMQKMKGAEPDFKLIGVRFPTLKTGDKALSTLSKIFDGRGAAISTSSKNPEQIAAWLDYAYSKEGYLLNNFGIEGESYTMVNGKPQYTDLILHNPKKLSVSQALSAYNLETASGPYPSDKSADLQWHADPETSAAMSTWNQADHSKELPVFSLNSDEQSQFAVIMADLNTYKDAMVNKFIMGAEPLSNFDEYTATLTKLGIENATKLEQDAFDRFLKK